MLKVVLILSISALMMGCGNVLKSGALVDAQNALDRNNPAKALEDTNIAESFGVLSTVEAAKLHYLRGQSLEALGRLREAAFSYQYVLEQHEGSAYAPAALQRLKALDAAL